MHTLQGLKHMKTLHGRSSLVWEERKRSGARMLRREETHFLWYLQEQGKFPKSCCA